MMAKHLFFLGWPIFLSASCNQQKAPKHLFILSGQSNMARLNPNESFTPAVATEFGKENVLVVKDAHGGQPIRRWYKGWAPPEASLSETNTPDARPPDASLIEAETDLYDALINKVKARIEGQDFNTVTFVWMQGERDARERFGTVYERSLTGLYEQLSNDLARGDMNFVIGRLSDFDLNDKRFPHWSMIRKIQEKVGSSHPRFTWIDTDDLNDGINGSGVAVFNDLHLSKAGYLSLGQQFADKSIELIKKNEASKN